jgi:hypothetical protein
MACGEFINTRSFAELYPLLDLSVPEAAARAVRDALALATNPNVVLHRCGHNPALLGRVIEWYLASSEEVRQATRAEIQSFAARARGRLEPEARGLLDAAAAGTLTEWRFAPTDLTALAHDHATRLEAAGDQAEAARVLRYIELRSFAASRAEMLAIATHPAGLVVPDAAPAEAEAAPPRHRAMDQPPDAAFHLDHVKSVAVFGAGRYGRLATELAERCGWTVAAFVDNGQHLWNTTIRGITVNPPATLRERPVDLVIVASHAHLDAISRQLEGMGLVYGCDFIPFLSPVQIGSVQVRLTL